MEPFEEEHFGEEESGSRPESRSVSPWAGVGAVALLVIAGIGTAYGIHERSMVNELKEQAATTNASMSQLQTQVSTLTAKLNDLNAPQPSMAQQTAATTAAPTSEEASVPTASDSGVAASTSSAGAATAASRPARTAHATAKHRATTDKRYSQLKSRLDEQEKQLKETQDAVAKNRSDLENSISSTKDELNGSIAKTHDELVALERRGERSYFEFDLSKSKQFQRVGPLTISLRKADTKHKSYDLAMIVDDNELNKKKVNLYEPIWIHSETGGQPLQVVVNRIDKNLVHGYVSAPKYKQSELAALSGSSTATTPDNSNAQPTATPQK